MSAKAAEFFEDLRRQGVASDLARTIAEAFDQRVSEAVSASAREAEEKSAAKFVSREEYHKRDRDLATRADLGEVRAELRAEIIESRAEMNRRFDGLYRILIVILLAALGAFASAFAIAVKILSGS